MNILHQASSDSCALLSPPLKPCLSSSVFRGDHPFTQDGSSMMIRAHCYQSLCVCPPSSFPMIPSAYVAHLVSLLSTFMCLIPVVILAILAFLVILIRVACLLFLDPSSSLSFSWNSAPECGYVSFCINRYLVSCAPKKCTQAINPVPHSMNQCIWLINFFLVRSNLSSVKTFTDCHVSSVFERINNGNWKIDRKCAIRVIREKIGFAILTLSLCLAVCHDWGWSTLLHSYLNLQLEIIYESCRVFPLFSKYVEKPTLTRVARVSEGKKKPTEKETKGTVRKDRSVS